MIKLAQALLLRSDHTTRIESLRSRITANALVQDGDEPDEDPQQLLEEALALVARQEELIVAIQATNASHVLADGRSLMQVIAQRNTLTAQHSLLQAAITAARKETDRYSSREIKWKSAISVAELQKRADRISRSLRDLNVVVQQANWLADVAVDWPGGDPPPSSGGGSPPAAG